MNKYGLVALKAVENIKKGNTVVESWENASIEVFNSSTSVNKGCPKSTFLGLCEEGLIKDVPSGPYTKSKKNKLYAIKAVEVLKHNPSIDYKPRELWNKVIEKPLNYNSQMDVVLSLWKNNLIK